MELLVSESAKGAARALAGRITVLARQAMGRRGVCNVALGLGPDASLLYAELVNTEIFWGRVNVFQLDERAAPDGHPDRAATALVEELADQVGLPQGRLHLMDAAAADLAAAARRYAAVLPERLDVVVMGAHHPAVADATGDSSGGDAPEGPGAAVVVAVGEDGTAYLRLAPAVVAAADHRFVLATGSAGGDAVARLRAGVAARAAAGPADPLVVYAERIAAG